MAVSFGAIEAGPDADVAESQMREKLQTSSSCAWMTNAVDKRRAARANPAATAHAKRLEFIGDLMCERDDPQNW
jgi:hypothetical protein